MGTEEFWVPALLAAAGSGAQYANTQSANNRQQAGEVQSIIDQQKLQQQARGDVGAVTRQVAQDNPATLANAATSQYVAQLRKNSAGGSQPNASTSGLAPVGNTSSAYKAGTKAAQQSVDSYGNNLAGEMGQIDAATRLRQNEGLNMQSLGTQLNTIGANSYTKNFVDQLRASAAGQANPWVSLGSSLLTAGAKNYTPNPKGVSIAGDPNDPSTLYGPPQP